MASADDAPAVRPEARAPHAPDFIAPEDPLAGERPSPERELRLPEWRAIHQRRFRVQFPDQPLPPELAPATLTPTRPLGPIARAGAIVRSLAEKFRERPTSAPNSSVSAPPIAGAHFDQQAIAAGSTDAAAPDLTVPPPALAGLALSGGGIRSATFCLGVLQGLRERSLLGLFDYVSTVSGGGFTGGWWSAWLSRRPMPDPPRASELFPRLEQLEPDRYPPRLLGDEDTNGSATTDATLSASVGDAVHHLRLYANYLTPRKGALSADLWRAVTTISRNIVLTWLVFGFVLFAAMLIASAYFVRSDPLAGRYICSAPEVIANVTPVTLADTACAGVNHTPPALSHGRVLAERFANAVGPAVLGLALMILLTGGWLVYGAVSPIPTLLGLVAFGLFILKVFVNYPGRWFLGFGGILAAALLLLGLPEVGRRPTLLWSQEGVTARGVIRTRLVQWHSLVLRGTVLVTAIVLLVGFAHELIWWLFYVPSGPVQAAVKKAGGIGAVLLAIASTAYTGFIAAPSPRGNDEGRATDKTHWLVLIAPPLALLVIAVLTAWGTHSMLRVTGAAAAASLIRSANAPTFTVGVAWALIAGAYLECAFAALEYWTERASMGRLWRSVGPLVALAIATTAFLLLTPVRVHSALVARGVAVDLVRADMIGQAVAGLAFVIVLLVWSLSFARRANDRTRVLLVFATFAFATVIGFSMKDPALTDRSSRLLFLVLATAQTAIAAAIGLGWMTDPNLVALHTFYKSRLVRGYLGASNTARHGRTEITDTVAGDDLLMCTLRNTEHGAPYHLINTTLNLVGGRDLATSQRSAATFVITRDTCGSARTGSRPTHLYMSGAMTLGTAVATSGAAFSPNMGTKTPSAAVAMLLALLNVRTGIWAPTPDKRRWRESQPRLWPYYLLRESLSQTNTLSSFCYLSDGGHFDNTGVYSLIERGVRFIVLADCGADPKPCFSDMGDLIRHCRIDFGTEISIDVEPMREASDELHSRHMVVGTILYSPEHGARLGWPASDDRKGILLWLKPAVVATDPADVRQYHLENKDFPQQTTLDQWFDEAQFESYRRLGLETARAAFKAVPEGTIDVATAAAAIAQ